MTSQKIRILDQMDEPLATLNVLQELTQAISPNNSLVINANNLSTLLLDVIKKLEKIQQDFEKL